MKAKHPKKTKRIPILSRLAIRCPAPLYEEWGQPAITFKIFGILTFGRSRDKYPNLGCVLKLHY